MREVGHSLGNCRGRSALTQSRGCRASFFCRYRLSRPEANLASAARFGSIHSLIGVSFELGGMLAVRGVHRNSNASRNRNRLAFQIEWFLQAGNQRLTDGLRSRVSIAILNDRQELIAANPGKGVGVANAAP